MYKKLTITIFLIVFLAGCATARRGQDSQAQQLQDRLNHLEDELRSKDREIADLEDRIDRTQYGKASLMEPTYSNIERSAIKQVQTALKNSGFYKGVIDGKMGPKTKDAIKKFQKAHGLKADGVAGKKTLAELNEYLTR